MAALGKALGLVLLCAIAVPASAAEELPLWELGAGIGVLGFPDYRGSDERNTLVIPIPYVIYRGDFLKVDRESVRTQLFESERLRLDVSLNGSIPVDNDDNAARSGLPDLDPTLEIGPNLNVSLWRAEDQRTKLDFRLPVRAVITTGLDYVGWVTQPQLNLDFIAPFDYQGWKLGLLAGPLIGDQGYHDYFYGVDGAFATATRPAFEADSGYSGSQFTAALSKRYPKFWVGGFVKWDTLDGATFENSPLVKTKSFGTAGLAMAWVFKTSEATVKVEREAKR